MKNSVALETIIGITPRSSYFIFQMFRAVAVKRQTKERVSVISLFFIVIINPRAGGEGWGDALPYMDYIGMCRCEGYGFQAVYSSIGYINQSVWV